MKVVEILRLSGEMLKKLHTFGIKINDYKYLPLFEDYEKMYAKGFKTTYIVAVLSKRYNLCERKVYKVLKHYQKDCQIDTV